MTVAARPRRPRLVPVGGILALIGCAVAGGCRPAAKPVTPPPGQALADDPFDSVREAFRKLGGVSDCRAALNQVNGYLRRFPEKAPRGLDDKAAADLAQAFGLSQDELTEVRGSSAFTRLDAHHLDQCFLFRDAARALEVQRRPPLERARAAFGWVMRQVRPFDSAGPMLPPSFVLRRGKGTPLERALVFFALLEQLDLDGCVVVVPGETAAQDDVRHWAPAVVVGKDVYLFDTRLGLPLPTADGRGVATLAQLRSDNGKLLKQLAGASAAGYDVTAEQLKQAELHLACPLSALALRMRMLEEELGADNKVALYVDAAARMKRLAQAGVPVKVWSRPQDPNSPTRVLREFLPKEEGGNDAAREGALPRQLIAQTELIPWSALPRPLQALLRDGPLGSKLQTSFAQVFAQFPLPPVPRDSQAQLIQGRVHEADGQSDNLPARFVHHLVMAGPPGGGQLPLHFLLAPGSPRDELLRGRWEEATTKLVEGLEQVRAQKALAPSRQDLDRRLVRWGEEARAAYGALFKAQQDAQRGAGTAALAEAQGRAIQVMVGRPDTPPGRVVQELPWLLGILDGSARPLGEEATYLLALAKHEQADRVQARLDARPGDAAEAQAARNAWMTAADWWRMYLDEYPAASAAVAAHRWRARALAALGQSDAARASLQALAGRVTGLQEVARLYELRQLGTK